METGTIGVFGQSAQNLVRVEFSQEIEPAQILLRCMVGRIAQEPAKNLKNATLYPVQVNSSEAIC